MSVIEVEDLSKDFRVFSRREGVAGAFRDLFQRDYRTLKAVDKISFSVEKGELLGYIGPNGAGKSTSIKMLTGILKPTSGKMEVLGYHPFKDRKTYTKHIGVVFGQRTQLWWDIAVIESFNLLSRIYEISPQDYKERLGQLTEILDLGELLHTPVRKLSLGQRLRCDLASSLIHDPKVLFLDEPTIGLDAVAKDSMRSFLRTINRDFGVTIILTTHDLKEIEELCRRIIVIDHGHIIYDGNLKNIRKLPGLCKQVSVEFVSTAPLDELSSRFTEGVKFTQESERSVVVDYDPTKISTVDLVKNVLTGYEIADLKITEPDIEEIVMKIYREGVSV